MMVALGRKSRMKEEIDAALELLSLPLTYSALNGVGIIEAEPFRFAFSTDLAQEEVRLVRNVSLEAIVQPVTPASEIRVNVDAFIPPHEDNGFSTLQGMRAAHELVTQVVRTLGPVNTIGDLGCGDGTLLAKLRNEGLAKHGWGCEIDAGKVERGRRRNPDLKLLNCQIDSLNVDLDLHSDVILLMPGRLLEMTEEAAEALKVALATQPKHVIAYCYESPGKLKEFAERTGLKLLNPMLRSDNYEAAEVDYGRA